MEPYTKEFMVGWGDLDANGHMRNTAYLDAAATTRFSFFAANGFPASKFQEIRLGPVVLKDEVQFFKELHLLQTYRVNFILDEMNEDGSRFRLKNEVFNSQGERAAVVLTNGAWFDLSRRKIIAPPRELFEVIGKLQSHP